MFSIAFKAISGLLLGVIFIASTGFAQPKIIIKLDDIAVQNNVCLASPVINILMERKIKAGLGVIAMKLDSTTLNVFANYLKATDVHGHQLFEIWHHGLYHSNDNPPNHNFEFKGTTYAFQKEHFNKADERVLKLMGVQMHTFGAPYNVTDENTAKVVAENANYKIFMFSGVSSFEINGVANYNNRVNMESETGKVNCAYFISQYEALKGKFPDYMILQGHPNQWDAARLEEFKKILDYLVSKKTEFVLPYDYYLATHKK